MQNQLEKYLSQIEKQLSTLPAEQRQGELREIRSHLEMMIEANVARGDDSNEAMMKALEQFGAAEKVGRELKHAKHIRCNHYLRMLLSGIVIVIIQLCSMQIIRWLMQISILTDEPHALFWELTFIQLCFGFICGWIAEVIAPRKTLLPLIVIVIGDYILALLTLPTMAIAAWESRPLFYLVGTIISVLVLFSGTWVRRWQVERRNNQSIIVVE